MAQFPVVDLTEKSQNAEVNVFEVFKARRGVDIFLRELGLALQSGCSVRYGLDLVSADPALADTQVVKYVREYLDNLEEGAQAASVFDNTLFFPPLLAALIAEGINISEVLERMADLMEKSERRLS